MVRTVNSHSRALKPANKLLQRNKDDVMACPGNWYYLTRMKASKNASISSILTQKCSPIPLSAVRRHIVVQAKQN